jgi:glycosyltransferase involved in cell wall biosynthesis
MGLVVVIMGQNCEKFLPMCLNSVKEADSIVFCDGGSIDKTYKILKENGFFIPDDWRCSDGPEMFKTSNNKDIIYQEYNQEDKGMNGKQRNFYLNYLKEHYPTDWAICLDADEVVENFRSLISFTQVAVPGVYSVKMRHFHNDLGHEDATQKEHFVLNRLFKISEVESYPEVEHPVLIPKEGTFVGGYKGTTIWHLAHIQHCFEIKKRYEKNMKHSNMHTPEFLHNWYLAHLLGQYPNTQVNPNEIPKVIFDYFGVDKDEFYFANRYLEVKHFLMTKQWKNYFKDLRTVIEYGCGLGPFGVGFSHNGCYYKGIEISDFAVKQAILPIELGDIRDYKTNENYDLCLCFDILEHLSYDDLDKALENIKEQADNFIFSVPVRGDPNLEADNTHIIKESKEWWIEKLSHYVNIEETPKHWLFANQIIVGKRK